MKKLIIFVILLIMPLAFLFGCDSKKSKSGGSALAVINGQSIDRESFVRLLHQSRAGNTETLPTDPVTWLQLKVAFLDQMIERILIEQEGVRRQIVVVDAEVESALDQMRADWPKGSFDAALADRQLNETILKDALRHNLLTELMAQKVVLPSIEITEEDVRSYYRRSPKEFSRPEQVRCRQILVKTEAQAAEVLTQIVTGASFSDMARAHSIAPEANTGGDLGYFGRGVMPKVVEDACFALDVHQTSDIIKSQYGYHIFRVETRRSAAVIPLNTARTEITRKLKNEKLDNSWQTFIAKLKVSAQIEINEEMLAFIGRDEI